MSGTAKGRQEDRPAVSKSPQLRGLGIKKIVWRCINRLDYGKKYCRHSPSLEEEKLQNAIMRAIQSNIGQCTEVLEKLKQHICAGLSLDENKDKVIDLQIEIVKLERQYTNLLGKMTSDMSNTELLESRLEEIIIKKHNLQNELQLCENSADKRIDSQSRLDEIFNVIEALKSHPLTFDNTLVRQILDCVVAESKDKIKVIFVGGYEVEVSL